MGGSARLAGQALRQHAAFDREIEAETARLTALLAGQSKAVADLAARYTEIHPAEQADLLLVKQQIAARTEQAAALAASREAILTTGAAEAKTGAALSAAWDDLRARQLAAAAAAETTVVAQQKATLSLRQLGASAQTAGRSLTTYLTLPLAAIGGFALKSSLDVAHAVDTIRQQTGATGATLAGLEASFRRVSLQVPQSFGDVSRAIALVAQRTHETGPALESLTRTELNLSRVTVTDLGQNVRQTTRLMQQWGIAVKEQVPFLDLLFRAHQQTGAGFDQLQNQLLRFGPALKSLGLGLADSAALLGTLEHSGANTDKVMQGLNIAMTRWAKAGITDAHQAMSNLIAAIQKAPTQMEALRIASQAGFGGRAGQDWVNTVRTAGFEFDKLSRKILGGSDTINKAAQQTLHFSDQFTMLQKAVELALRPLGDLIGNQLGKLADRLKAETPALEQFTTSLKSQSSSAKEVEAALSGIAIFTGPVLYALGRVVQGFVALRTTVLAGAGAARTALLSFVIPAAAITAVTLFFTAFATNFHGLRDDLLEGWRGIWGNIENRIAAFVQYVGSAFRDIRHLSLDIGSRLESDWAEFGRRTGNAYVDAQRSAFQARITTEQQRAVAAGSSSIGDLRREEAVHIAGPFLPTGMHLGKAPPAGRSRGGFGGGQAGAAPQLQAMTKAQQEALRFTTELAAKQEELNVLLAGESNIAGQVAAHFPLIAKAQRDQLVAIEEAIKREQKRQSGLERYYRLLAEVNAKIREVEAGGKPASAARDFGSGVTPAMVQKLQERERLLAADEARERKRAAVSHEIETALGREEARHASLTGGLKREATVREQLAAAYATHDKAIIAQAEHLVRLTEADNRLAAALTRSQNEQRDQQAILDKVAAGLQTLSDKHAEATGATAEEVKATDVYAESLKVLPGILQGYTFAAIAQAEIDQQLIEHKKAHGKLSEEITSRTGQEQAAIESLTGSTKESAVAEQLLTKARADGDAATINAAENLVALAKQHEKLAAAKKLDTAEEKAYESALHKTASFAASEFDKAFKQLATGGARGFFRNLLNDLDQFLTDWAAKIAAAQLTQALFGGLLGPGGGQAGGAGTGALGGLLGGLVGLFGGGGVPSADVLLRQSGADIFGLQGGGAIFGGQVALVGERGPEAFIAPSAGQVYPTHSPVTQSLRSGGGPTVVHMTVNTPDVAGFQRSQAQIAQDMSRQIERHRKRAGF